MTKEETSKIIFILMSSYPVVFKNVSAEKTATMIQSWNAILSDYSYEDVEQGVYVFISANTTGFPPDPGQIIDKIKMLHPKEPEMEALEAWVLVEKAVSNSAYNSVEEFLKLPPLIQKAVGRPEVLKEWALMDTDAFQTVEQSHFIRTYDVVKKREKEYERIPSRMRGLIESTIRSMPQIPEIKPQEEQPYEPKELPPGIEEQIEVLRQEFERSAT